MAKMPSMADSGLEEHYEFLTKIGRIISGRRALDNNVSGVHVFQLPDHKLLQFDTEAREMEYGTLGWDDQGYHIQESGVPVYPVGNAHEKLEFLASIRQIVLNKKRDLSIDANKEHDGRHIRPGGQKGHVLKMYEDLIDQIDRTHYRLRDKIEDAA